MNIDFAVAVAVLAISALILHFKSHVKFVALGVFMGLVLIEVLPLRDYLFDPTALAIARIALLALPALTLGVNHAVDKRRMNILKTIFFVGVFTLFFLSSLMDALPTAWQNDITSRSIIGFQILEFELWFALGAAVLILQDSFSHKAHAGGKRKR